MSGSTESGEGAGRNAGLYAALKGVAANLLATGRTRLQLLGSEIEEEKLRAIRMVLMAQGMVFCFGVGVLLLVALTVALFWDNRIALLGGSATLFLLLGALFYRQLIRSTQRPEPVFAASLAELEEDLRQLKAATGHDRPAA